jgi:hypothetical protein
VDARAPRRGTLGLRLAAALARSWVAHGHLLRLVAAVPEHELRNTVRLLDEVRD